MKVGDLVTCIETKGFSGEGDLYFRKDDISIGDVLEIKWVSSTSLKFKSKTYGFPITSFQLKNNQMTQVELDTLKALINKIEIPKPIQVDPETKPLEKFSGYTIYRSDDYIAFGCGAVTVKKDDLKLAIEFLELEEQIKELKAKQALFEKNKVNYTNAFSSLAKQYYNYSGSKVTSQIKKIGAKTLKRILGA